MRIALAQLCSGPDPAANLDLLAAEIERAAEAGAELVIFPEATMRCFGRSLIDIAEPIDGPWAGAVSTLAVSAGLSVAVGMFTPGEGDRVRNTLLITGPDGHRVGYHKLHLFDAFGFAESDTVTAGDVPLVTKVGDLTVGWTLCYDVRFPALFTRLALDGAELIVVAASWGAGPGKLDQWRLLARARALDTTAYVAACGQADPSTLGRTGHSSTPTGIGHSLLVGPDGAVLAEAGAAPELLVLDLDPARVAATRAQLPVLANRRAW